MQTATHRPDPAAGPGADPAPDFRRLWIGHLSSLTGSRAAAAATPLLILAWTHSATDAGMVSTAFYIGFLGIQLPAGLLIDRSDRRRIMLGCDLLGLIAVACITVLLSWRVFTIWALAPANFALGISFATFMATESASLPRLVSGDDKVARAITLNQVRNYAAGLTGPPLGGFLFSVAQAAPYAANAVGYIISLLNIRAIRTPLQAATVRQPPRPGQLRRQLAEGLRYVAATPFVRTTLVYASLGSFVINATTLYIVLRAASLGVAPFTIGLILAAGGIGGLTGAFAATRYASRLPSATAMLAAVPLLTAVLLAIITTTTSAVVLGAAYAILFIPWPAWNGVVTARWITGLPDHKRGRIMTVTQLLNSGPSALAPLLTGILATSLGLRTTGIIAAALMLTMAIAALTPAIRQTVDHQHVTSDESSRGSAGDPRAVSR